jgi:hypothetical protein
MIRQLILGLSLSAAPLTAQQQGAAPQDSLMREVVRLATEGQTDSAKAIIDTQLSRLSPFSGAYPHVLFTAGLVSDTAETAEQYFRRVSIEYSDSPWADRSLLRLAQLAFADGDLGDSRRYTDRILLDYPTSPVRAEAAFWAGRAEFDLNNSTAGCQYMAQAQSESSENIELGNRAIFYLQRCADVFAAQRAGTGNADSAAVETPDPGTTLFTVQVAAVRTASAADAAMQSLQARGYASRVLRQDGFFKVRVGRFTRRSDADDLARQLRRRLGDGPFVVEERQ